MCPLVIIENEDVSWDVNFSMDIGLSYKLINSVINMRTIKS